MITLSHFDDIKYFEPEEFSDPDYIGSWVEFDHDLLFAMDRLRGEIDAPVIVHSAVCIDGLCEHSADSYHLLCNGCRAIDFHVDTKMTLRTQYQIIESMCVYQGGTFMGIGVYPEWNNPGFHLDYGDRYQRWVLRGGVYTYLLP